MKTQISGYSSHKIVTLCGRFTYEEPIKYSIKKTAFGGWWGIATFADGTVVKKFRGEPMRIVKVQRAA